MLSLRRPTLKKSISSAYSASTVYTVIYKIQPIVHYSKPRENFILAKRILSPQSSALLMRFKLDIWSFVQSKKSLVPGALSSENVIFYILLNCNFRIQWINSNSLIRTQCSMEQKLFLLEAGFEPGASSSAVSIPLSPLYHLCYLTIIRVRFTNIELQLEVFQWKSFLEKLWK